MRNLLLLLMFHGTARPTSWQRYYTTVTQRDSVPERRRKCRTR